ncbi:hypothetical protein PilKf_00912 [Pillotina sp. SPG140]|jgi:hypothetical protein
MHTHGNLLVSLKTITLFLFLFLITITAVSGDQWYRSNKTASLLEAVNTQAEAFPYSVYSEFIEAQELPVFVGSFVQPSYTIEQRTLYESEQIIQRHWFFFDLNQQIRLHATAYNGETVDWVEQFDGEGALVSALYVPDALTVQYFYREKLLVRTETHSETLGLLATDYYRYTRQAVLRAIERVYPAAVDSTLIIKFPPPPRTPLNGTYALDSPFLTEVRSGHADAQVVHTVDTEGRVVKEQHTAQDGSTEEWETLWEGDNIKSVRYTTATEERRIDYVYDSEGNRIEEWNYRNGILERTVKKQDDQEVEELYIQGKVVLRAYWKGSLKVREERVKQ